MYFITNLFSSFFPFLVSFLLLYMFCVFKYSSASSGRPEGTHSLRFIGRFCFCFFVCVFSSSTSTSSSSSSRFRPDVTVMVDWA